MDIVVLLLHRVLIYSGDQDSVIPLIGSRTLVQKLARQLGLSTTVPYRVWFEGQQVGGWTQVYGNILSFALVLFKSFLEGRPLPSPPHHRRTQDSLEEQSSQGNFVPHGRKDILATAIGCLEHPGRVRGAGRGVGIINYFGRRSRCGPTSEGVTKEDLAILTEQITQNLTEKLTQKVRQDVMQWLHFYY